MQRPITGFHRDAEGDWVAELSCGHGQHTRDHPPLAERPWVRSAAGRASRIGTFLDCLRCDRRELPADCDEYRRTQTFTTANVPRALRTRHATRPGVWALIHGVSGALRVRLYAGEPALHTVGAGASLAIPPEVAHDVEPQGESAFCVAFHRCAPGTAAEARVPSPELVRILEALREAKRRAASQPFDVAAMRASAVAPWPIPEDCVPRRVELGGMPCFWLCAAGADPKRRLLYLHGGGWVSGGLASHGPHAAALSKETGCVVLLPEFRLAPEHPFPAALDDARAAWHFLRSAGPEGPGTPDAAFVGGDSGGGGLTLSLLLALRDAGDPLPDAAFTLSAVTDLTASGASMRTRADDDPIIDPQQVPQAAALYLGAGDARDPLVSPVFGDYHGLPPLLLQVGDAEVMLDDTLRVAERAREAGVALVLEVWEGLFHGFQLFAPQLPEGREALERVGWFLRAHPPGR